MGARTVRRRSARYAPGIAAVLVAAAIAGRAGAAAPVVPPPPPSVPGQALVRFDPGTSSALVAAAHARAGAHVVKRIPAIGFELVAFPEQLSLDAVLASYNSDPNVAVAEPNLIGRAALDPQDPCVASACPGSSKQYSLDVTNARAGWDRAPGRFFTSQTKPTAPPVTIAVLDAKIDATHPDFVNAGGDGTDVSHGGQLDLANARDWVPANKQSGWAAYHGTYVAGIAAASTNNARGIAGIGYAARILPLTVVAGDGTTDAASLADAIVYAWQKGARIVNLSLGIVGDSQAVHAAIKTVTNGSSPALVVAAAGNNTGSAAFYPGSYPEVMSVSGTTAGDTRAPCSNYNANVSVAAPAERVVSLAPMPNELTTASCGTSAAAPHVSGLASLLFAQDPSRTPAQVRTIIERSAEDRGNAGKDVYFGWGRINVERALRYGDGTPGVHVFGATMPKTSTPSSTVTAVATSATGVVRAELRFRSLNATPVALVPIDGSFGGTTESLRATVSVPSSLPGGAHPFFVRAFDGTAWGPYSVGVVIVDRTPPQLWDLTATYGVRATGQPVNVTFRATDDLSKTVAYAIQVFSDGPTKSLIFQDARFGVAAGGQSYTWQPGSNVLPGSYTIKVMIADEAGNGAAKLVGTILT